MHKNEGYLGNINVKRAGVEAEWTEEQILEYKKCMENPIYFIENYVKIISLDEGLVPFKLYGYQEELIEHFDENRFSVVLACRQSGKSITTCAFLLWYLLFQPEQTIAILANKGAIAREMLTRITTMLEHIPFFLQPGTKVLNRGSIEFENESRIIASATGANSIRGLSVNLLYLDEFAFVENAEQFYTSTYPVITSGGKSKVIITSTANGIGNMYHKLYEGAVQEKNEYKDFRVNWFDVPGRDDEWKATTIANTSELQFEQEFGNSFLGTGNTLINANTLLGLQIHDPIWYKQSTYLYEEPVIDHTYIMCVDTAKGRGQDYSTFTIIDVTEKPFKQVAIYRDNMISPLLFPDIIYRYAKMYNNALVIIENNDSGQIVCNQLFYDIEYDNVFTQSSVKRSGIGVTMTKKTKQIGCSTLKEVMEENKLQINDKFTINELITFVSKGQSWEADGGNHDDLVMNLVLFSWFITTPFFQSLTDLELKKLLYDEQQQMIDDDMVPAGIFSKPTDEPDIFVEGGDVWTVVGESKVY
jgi:hypothetical protein|tara:strand:- start:47 stop:1636 length:1590 start_codon:yes stop_codon:yes gene_type:complete